MKKMFRVLALTFVLLLIITATVTATMPEKIEGFVPLSSLKPSSEWLEYDFCDPLMVGHAKQPAASPGLAVHGVMTFGNVDSCPHTTTLTGSCSFMLIPVESFGEADSKLGRAVIKKCKGDAAGLHGRFVVYNDYKYTAWYHWEP